MNYQLRKIIKNRGHFPDDDAVIKLLWLAICTIPVVIGDFDAMRIGAQRAGLDPDTVRVITDPRAAENDPNVIEMVQTGQVLADIAVGQLSPVAGDGSYRFVVEACRLARDGMVDGIVTAPLNKAAMQAGGHKWPGHTELRAYEFGVQNFSLVLSAGDLYFFHLTAQVSLQLAIESAGERAGQGEDVVGALGRGVQQAGRSYRGVRPQPARGREPHLR